MKNIYLLVLVFLLFSCSKYDENEILTDDSGVIMYLPTKWKMLFSLDNNWLNYTGTNHGNMVFGNNVLITIAKNAENRCLALVNSDNGSILWQWNDWYQPETETGNFTNDVRYQNYLFWVTRDRRYTIDMETGKTIHKYRYSDHSFYFRYASENNVFYMLDDAVLDDGSLATVVFRGNIFDEYVENILHVPYHKDSIGSDGIVKSIEHIELYEKDNVKYYVVTSAQSYPQWYHDIRLNLYNVTENKWEYLDYPVAGKKQNNGGWKKIYKDKIYMTCGKEFFCFDILSGKRIWKREFAHDFVFSGYEIVDDIIVANCEDKNLYGLDVNTGRTLWKGEGAGTSSRLYDRILNGIVYFKGGSSGYIHAVDIYNGKTLWKLDPYLYEKSNAFWSEDVNVVQGKNGEKGKIVVKNALNTYCFDVVR